MNTKDDNIDDATKYLKKQVSSNTNITWCLSNNYPIFKDKKYIILEIIKNIQDNNGKTRNIKKKNPKVQFEYHSDMFNKHIIEETYQWCLDNLPLKPDRGIIFDVNKLFIVTSFQKIVDKLNKKFGSSFTFNSEDFWDNRIYFLKP